jgi:hypothetical protein
MIGVHRGMIMNQLHIHGSYKLYYFWSLDKLYVIFRIIQNEWNLMCYYFW